MSGSIFPNIRRCELSLLESIMEDIKRLGLYILQNGQVCFQISSQSKKIWNNQNTVSVIKVKPKFVILRNEIALSLGDAIAGEKYNIVGEVFGVHVDLKKEGNKLGGGSRAKLDWGEANPGFVRGMPSTDFTTKFNLFEYYPKVGQRRKNKFTKLIK